jgi:hypothetical protein
MGTENRISVLTHQPGKGQLPKRKGAFFNALTGTFIQTTSELALIATPAVCHLAAQPSPHLPLALLLPPLKTPAARRLVPLLLDDPRKHSMRGKHSNTGDPNRSKPVPDMEIKHNK